jgi:hypothetical protein
MSTPTQAPYRPQKTGNTVIDEALRKAFDYIYALGAQVSGLVAATKTGQTVSAQAQVAAQAKAPSIVSAVGTSGGATGAPGVGVPTGGTAGEVLEKNSGTDYDTHWVALGGAAALNVGTTAGTVAAGDDARLSNARTPTAHAATHASGGSDPVTLAESQITNLATDLAGKEPALGNPSTSGYVLSSTTGGARSWVAQSGGGGAAINRFSLTMAGALAVDADPASHLLFPPALGMTATGVTAQVKTAPTGASLIVLVKANGTTIYTLTFTAGSTTATATGSVSIAAGAVISLAVTQVGSSIVGSDLSMTVYA